MDIEQSEMVRRASLYRPGYTPRDIPRHFVCYCTKCFRAFGVDTIAVGCCGEMHVVSGTLLELRRFQLELVIERSSDET